MADVAAETRIDGSKDEGKLKNSKAVDEDLNDSSNGPEEEEEEEEEPEPAVKKTKVANENSINDVKTANDHGKEESDTSRSTPRGGRASKGSKRQTPMSKIAKEGEALFGAKGDTPDSERRQTRSQTRGTPPVTIKKTPRQESNSKRSRKGRPRKEENDDKEKKESEKEDEDTAEEMNNADDKEAGENTTSEGTGEEEESQPENEPADEKK